MEKIKIGLLACLFFVCNISYAQDTISIGSFDEIWDMARTQNPTLGIYQMNSEKAASMHKVSKSFLLPTISAGGNFQNNIELPVTVINGDLVGRPGETINAQFGQKYVYSVGLSLNYTLLDWQKIIAAQSAKNNVELQKSQEQYYLQNLKKQTALLYYQTLVAQRSLEISRSDLEVAASNLKIVEKKYEQEAISVIDLNQAKINYNIVEKSTLVASEFLEYNLYELKKLLGLFSEDVIKLSGSLPEQLNEQDYDLKEDKLLVTYDLMEKNAAFSLKSEKVANSFKLSLNGFMGSQQFNDNFSMRFGKSSWYSQKYVGISISRPLFTGFVRNNRVRAAQSTLRSQQLETSIAHEQSEINDARLLSQLERSVKSVNNLYNTYKLYSYNLSIYEAKYNEGAIALDVYLNYFDNYLKAENNYLSELSSYYSNLSTIISRY